MENFIDSLVVKLKKLSFEKTSSKSPQIMESSEIKLQSLVTLERKKLSSKSQTFADTIVISALLERAKDLKIMALLSKNKSKKNIQYNYIYNIAVIHENVADSIADLA